MADFIVDPNGNVKDCRWKTPPQSPPVIPQRTFHPLLGYPLDPFGSTPTMMEKLKGFLCLMAFAGALWFILAGICWLITGEWPRSNGRAYHPIFNRSITAVPRPPPFTPPVPKPPGRTPLAPPMLRDELTKPEALNGGVRDWPLGLPNPPPPGSNP